MSRRGDGRRAISPVVGVALMLAITVTLAAVTAGALYLSTSELSEPAPMFTNGGHVEMTVENGTISEQDLVLVHQAGTDVPVDELDIVFDTGNGVVRMDAPRTGELADGTWSTGEKLSVQLDADEVCTGSDEIEVRLQYESDRQSFVVGEQRVPVRTAGFQIVDGAVVPESGYTAEVKILGTGFTYGAGGPNIDIRLDVTIGNTPYDPWPGNVNNNGNPRTHTFDDQPAGAGLSVAATADTNGIYISPRTRNSTDDDGWVYTLRDGDTPPNIAGFGDQEDAAAYVAPYLDENGDISLADNEAIVLFELGNSQTGDAADFQDIVVLVTLETEQTEAAVTESTASEYVVICPSE